MLCTACAAVLCPDKLHTLYKAFMYFRCLQVHLQMQSTRKGKRQVSATSMACQPSGCAATNTCAYTWRSFFF
jgi:hypothetical protein